MVINAVLVLSEHGRLNTSKSKLLDYVWRPGYVVLLHVHFHQVSDKVLWNEGWTRLLKFKFSAKFPIGLYVREFTTTDKKFKTRLNQMRKTILTKYPLRCSYAPSWNNLKLSLFWNYTVEIMLLTSAYPVCCHRVLPIWIRLFRLPGK